MKLQLFNQGENSIGQYNGFVKKKWSGKINWREREEHPKGS